MFKDPLGGSAVDPVRASVARVYDFLLGGSTNFAVDRALAATVLEAEPNAAVYARENRAFLGRAVRALIERGIRQFIDVGCGLPIVGSVHEVAHKIATDVQVVYVDVDPVVLTFSRRLTAGDARLGAIEGDVRDPVQVLRDAAATGLVSLAEPVAVLMVALLHFVSDADDPARLVTTVREATAPGSCLAVSHAARPFAPRPSTETVERAYAAADTGLTLRTRGQVRGLLRGWELLDPGVAMVSAWRRELTDEPAPYVPGYAAVAVKATGSG